MPSEPDRTRPRLARSPHELVLVEHPPRALTIAKIAGLVAITTLGVALATAILAGGVLFAILSFG